MDEGGEADLDDRVLLGEVEEEEVVVGRHRVLAGRDQRFGLVAHRTHCLHGLEARDTGRLGALVRRGGSLHGVDALLEVGDARLELAAEGEAALLGDGEHLGLDHVDPAELDLDHAAVLVVHRVAAGLGLVGLHDAELLEELDVLGQVNLRGLDARVAHVQALLRLGRPLLP